MGEKYEALPFRIFKGYHDPTRPTQVKAGMCYLCGLPVWVVQAEFDKAMSKDPTYQFKMVHFSCR